VDFIKMDVEGSEVAAVRGMSGLLSREDAPPILYESNGHTLNLFGETPARLMALLTKPGYRCYLVDWNRLVLCSADELQAEVCVNYLAAKCPLEALGEWPILPAMPFEGRIRKILRSSVSPNVAARAHVARALSRADAATLSDRRVVNALAVLKTDGDASVRTDVAWWQESEPDRAPPSFSRQGGEGDADASASRAEAHQYYTAILRQDLQGGQVPQRQRGLVRGMIELARRVLSAARAELRRWTKWG
jgi:hypothetical protein